MRHLIALASVVALILTSVAIAGSENGNKLLCFDGTTDGGFNGVCTLTADGATLNTIDGDTDPNGAATPGRLHPEHEPGQPAAEQRAEPLVHVRRLGRNGRIARASASRSTRTATAPLRPTPSSIPSAATTAHRTRAHSMSSAIRRVSWPTGARCTRTGMRLHPRIRPIASRATRSRSSSSISLGCSTSPT